MGGYFKVWRKIEDSKSWSRGALYRGLMITLLQKANWKQGYFHGQEILPGQLACSGASLASELDLSRYQVMRMLATLEDDGFISRQTFGKVCTLITVVNWQLYQSATEEAAQQPHNGRTSSAQVPHTIEEGKKARKEIPPASADAAEKASPPGKGKAGRRRGAHRFRSTLRTAPPELPHPLPGKGPHLNRRIGRRPNVPAHGASGWRGSTSVWDAFGYKRNKAEAADAFLDIKGTIRVPCVCYLPGCPTGSGAQARPCGAGQDAEDADRAGCPGGDGRTRRTHRPRLCRLRPVALCLAIPSSTCRRRNSARKAGRRACRSWKSGGMV